jgi:hypothetical protein
MDAFLKRFFLNMYSEIKLQEGKWIRFKHNGMQLTGEIVKPFHSMVGLEGRFFTIKLFSPNIEMTFRIDRVSEIQKSEPPLFSK